MTKEVYDQSWHDTYSKQTLASARAILPDLLSLLNVKSICEFGCGHGHWLMAASDLGVDDILGLDGEWTETNKLLFPGEWFMPVNLGKPLSLKRQYDLAISLEVGEHIEPENAGTFVKNITATSNVVLFGAAIPLQGGFRHVNEQYPSYWSKLFDQEGYDTFDLVRPVHWTNSKIHYYYRQNILVYVNRLATNLIEECRQTMLRQTRDTHMLDVIHPEKYDLMASYDAIALKRLIPKLPNAIISLLRR